MELRFLPSDPKYAEWWLRERDDEVTRQFNPLAPATAESLRARLSKSSSDFADFESADAYFWAIEAEGALVGHVTLQNINRMMLTAEIGYGVSSSHRGKGIATQVIRELAKRVFTESPIRKLIAFVHEGNSPSRRALEKVGFKLEGVLRDHYLIQGNPVNEAVYGLLRSDFKN